MSFTFPYPERGCYPVYAELARMRRLDSSIGAGDFTLHIAHAEIALAYIDRGLSSACR